MSAASKVKHSRQRWKQKAERRAEANRYLRKELERLKRERDAYKQHAKQAEAKLRCQPTGVLRPAIESKVDLVHLLAPASPERNAQQYPGNTPVAAATHSRRWRKELGKI